MNKTSNPIAIQSKEMLVTSLLQLMKNTAYENITIMQITENAQLSRRTFYRNFDSKDEIIQYHLSSLREEYLQHLLELPSFSLKDSFDILLTLCFEHASFLQLLKQHNLLHILLLDWTISLPKLHQIILPKFTDFPKDLNSESLEYLLTFNAGGVYNIIIKWIYDDMQVPISRLKSLIHLSPYQLL